VAPLSARPFHVKHARMAREWLFVQGILRWFHVKQPMAEQTAQVMHPRAATDSTQLELAVRGVAIRQGIRSADAGCPGSATPASHSSRAETSRASNRGTARPAGCIAALIGAPPADNRPASEPAQLPPQAPPGTPSAFHLCRSGSSDADGHSRGAPTPQWAPRSDRPSCCLSALICPQEPLLGRKSHASGQRRERRLLARSAE
jgi:hypothetical protein